MVTWLQRTENHSIEILFVYWKEHVSFMRCRKLANGFPLFSFLISYCLFLLTTSSFLLLFQLLASLWLFGSDTGYPFLVLVIAGFWGFVFVFVLVFLHLPYFYHHVLFFFCGEPAVGISLAVDAWLDQSQQDMLRPLLRFLRDGLWAGEETRLALQTPSRLWEVQD